MTDLRCGDHIYHGKGDAHLVVAWVHDNHVGTAGWPNSVIPRAEVVRTYVATDEKHREAVLSWAKSDAEPFRSRVLRMYGPALGLDTATGEPVARRRDEWDTETALWRGIVHATAGWANAERGAAAGRAFKNVESAIDAYVKHRIAAATADLIAKHDACVTELLAANNAEVERRRKAERDAMEAAGAAVAAERERDAALADVVRVERRALTDATACYVRSSPPDISFWLGAPPAPSAPVMGYSAELGPTYLLL
jgi:hypothetical protein